MDYKSLYLDAFKQQIQKIDLEITSRVKESRKRNKNFTTLINNLTVELEEQEAILKSSLNKTFPDIHGKYQNRFREYDSDHLNSFFTYDFTEHTVEYSQNALITCASELGALEGTSRAANNFSNSTEFLKAIYVLDKNYDFYSLDFDPNDNPLDSDLFHRMQKERFPNYGKEPDWEAAILKISNSKELKEQKHLNKKEPLQENSLKPGGAFDKTEKRYILHLLYELLSQGSEMKATEFMRILHLTTDIIDTSAEITGNPPHYRQVHEGFSKYFPKNEKIKLIKKVFSKIQAYQLPMLKQILNDKLIALTKAK